MALRCLITLAFCALLSTETCSANEVAPPPLTEKGLLGRWEGPGAAADYWFRMELFPGGGYLAVVQRTDYALYKLEQSRLVGRNKMTLRFRGIREKFPSAWDVVRVEAIGYSLDGSGELHADLTQSSSGNARLTFHVYFEKGAVPSRDLVKMLKRADELVRNAKRDHL